MTPMPTQSQEIADNAYTYKSADMCAQPDVLFSNVRYMVTSKQHWLMLHATSSWGCYAPSVLPFDRRALLPLDLPDTDAV